MALQYTSYILSKLLMYTRPPKHHRRSTRLKGFDYSQPGLYFITKCTINKEKLFGEVFKGNMNLNEGGKIVLECWQAIPRHYSNVKLHAFIVMPNHIHGILEIIEKQNLNVLVNHRDSKRTRNEFQHILPGSLGAIMRGFEIGVTKWFRKTTDIHSVWQRNFHDTIIKSDQRYHAITKYIKNNPKNWRRDEFY